MIYYSEQLFSHSSDNAYGCSIHQVCRSLNHAIAALQAATERCLRYGFPELFLILQWQRYSWNHQRLVSAKVEFSSNGQPTTASTQSLITDYVGSAEPELTCGCCFRTFNVVEDFNREVLSIEIALNLSTL